MNEQMVERVARSFVAGEDWMLTDEINRLMPQVVHEIQRRGGQATVTGGRIVVRKFVLDMLHAIPLEIKLFEGSYYPGKVLVEATFGPGHPVPVQDRQPFNAKAIVDAIADAFMSLVNYKASDRTAVSWGERSFGDYLDAVETILDKKGVSLTQKMMDFIAECQEAMASPADCAKDLIRGGWRVHSPSTAASEMLAVARMLTGADPKMPPEIDGQETNENAWNACVEMAKAQKAWAQKIVRDKKWMSGASDMSKQMAQDYASKSIEDMAKKSYSYHQMRHEIGTSSKWPGAYGADIRAWKQMIETGKHPDLGVFKK